MSAKKSWDVERSARKVVSQTPPPARRENVRTPKAHKAAKPAKKVRPVVSSEPLKVRRARAKRIFLIGVSVLALLCVAGLFYVAWLPALRVQTVTAEGLNSEGTVAIAQQSLQGTHLFIVPRNSLFFVPESDMRKRILAEFPDIVAVSFKSSGLTGLHVVPVARTSAFVWCGVERVGSTDPCYAADPDGLIFAPYTSDVPMASSTLQLRMYAPIEGDVLAPVRAHIANTKNIPNTLQLARALKTLNANIAEVAFRGDEADLYTAGGTRITYIVGQEREAATLAASVFPTLSLNDGSVDYVDLRFESKVYLRKQGVGQ